MLKKRELSITNGAGALRSMASTMLSDRCGAMASRGVTFLPTGKTWMPFRTTEEERQQLTSLRDELFDDYGETLDTAPVEDVQDFWSDQALISANEVTPPEVALLQRRLADQPFSSVKKAFEEWWSGNKFFPHLSEIEKRVKFFTWQLNKEIDRVDELINYDQEADPSTRF